MSGSVSNAHPITPPSATGTLRLVRRSIDLPLAAGDHVDVATVRSGLCGGSCRSVEKVVESVNEEEDRVYFTDGSTYNHVENPGHILRRAVKPRNKR